MMDRVDLRGWLGKSRARDEARSPVVGVRLLAADGQALSSLEFLDPVSASALAAQAGDVVALEPAYLRIERPLVETPDEATAGLGTLSEVLGPEAPRRLAAKFVDAVEATGSFEPWRAAWGTITRMAALAPIEQLQLLQVPLQVLLRDRAELAQLAAAGFDGAIFGNGSRQHWVVFDERQVRPAIAAGWPHSPAWRGEPTPQRILTHSSVDDVRAAVTRLLGLTAASEAFGRVIVTTAAHLLEQLRGQDTARAAALLSATPGTSGALQGYLTERRLRRRRALQEIGDVGDGVVLRRAGEARWLLIAPDASAAGRWRVQPFTEDGFEGHASVVSREAAVHEAAAAGYTQRDDQALDRLQDSPRFQRGLLVAELCGQMNKGEISLSELRGRIAHNDQIEAVLASVGRQNEQACCDPVTGSIFLLADRIARGHEEAVLLHELMHKHGRSTLGPAGWRRLVGAVKAWRTAKVGSAAHLIYLAADARARAAASGDRSLYEEELFSYAVEEAVLRGYAPSALAHEGSVERWLDDVESTLRGVLMQLTQKPQEPLSAQQLVDFAYAMAQMENPERAARIRERLGGDFEQMLAQAEAGARAQRRAQRAAAPPPVRMSNQAVGTAFNAILQRARDDLAGVLMNWNDSELTDEGMIVAYPGRDREFSSGAQGGRVNVSKREFLEWLASDAPFHPGRFGEQITEDVEWKGQIDRLRSAAGLAGQPRGAPAPDAPRKSLRPVSAALQQALREHGEPVLSVMDARRRFSDGERLFVFHEQDEEPNEARELQDLEGYTPEQILALPAPGTPALAETPAFKAWFGDWQDRRAHSSRYPADKVPVSQAVAADGSPRVMYHATNADFSVFELGRPTVNSTTLGPVETERHAIFASPEIGFAEEHLSGGATATVMPVYLDVKSPVDLREGVPGPVIAEIVARTDLRHADFHYLKPTDTWQVFDGEFGRKVVAALKEAGYDGAILLEVSRNRQTEHEVWAAFEPGQVKSAIGNHGQFDRRDSDIRHSARVIRPMWTDHAAFREWFAGSKVVDEQGQPLVVYHGTKSDFDTFDSSHFGASDEGLAGKGIYFTYNPEEASGYALNETFGKGYAPNVRPVYVSLKNPFVITQGVMPDGRKVQDLHQGIGINAKGGAAVRTLAEDAGHDGVMWVSRDGAVRHVVAWKPEQIKSAIGDPGTFDASNPDISLARFPRASSAIDAQRTREIAPGVTGYIESGGWGTAIYEWNGNGEGKTRAALQDLKRPITVIDPGEPGSASYAYWRRMLHDGVIDHVQDDENQDITEEMRKSAADSSRTHAFKMWFAGSKVVDEDGRPRVVYHGTLSPAFDAFDISPENAYEGGAYFSTSQAVASHFADPERTGNDPEEEGYAPHVIPAYMSIKNPKVLQASDVMTDGTHSFDAMRRAMMAARKEGYDGARIVGAPEAGEDAADQWVAFSPSQIKSAIGNAGTFDRQNPDMRRSVPARPARLAPAVQDAAASPAFRDWFEDSVVVDASGWPMPVFHGTTRSFARFSTAKLGEKTGALDARTGFFFAENPDAADQFTWEAGEPYGGNLMPVYLRLSNPMVVRDLVLDGSTGTRAGLVMARAKAAGHDGVIFEHSDMLGRKGRAFAVFSPDQVKSVTGNRGTWSRRSTDVRLSIPATHAQVERSALRQSVPRTAADRLPAWKPRPLASGMPDDPFDFAADPAFHHLFFGTPTAREISAFARWLRERPNAFVRLYHGTAAGHPVLDQGLLPASARRRNSLQSANGYVCASVYAGHARQFGAMAALNSSTDGAGYRVAVYPVVTTIRRLCADLDQLRNRRSGGLDCGNSLAESLVHGHGARARGRLEPQALRAPRLFRTTRSDEEGEQVEFAARPRLVA